MTSSRGQAQKWDSNILILTYLEDAEEDSNSLHNLG